MNSLCIWLYWLNLRQGAPIQIYMCKKSLDFFIESIAFHWGSQIIYFMFDILSPHTVSKHSWKCIQTTNKFRDTWQSNNLFSYMIGLSDLKKIESLKLSLACCPITICWISFDSSKYTKAKRRRKLSLLCRNSY